MDPSQKAREQLPVATPEAVTTDDAQSKNPPTHPAITPTESDNPPLSAHGAEADPASLVTVPATVGVGQENGTEEATFKPPNKTAPRAANKTNNQLAENSGVAVPVFPRTPSTKERPLGARPKEKPVTEMKPKIAPKTLKGPSSNTNKVAAKSALQPRPPPAPKAGVVSTQKESTPSGGFSIADRIVTSKRTGGYILKTEHLAAFPKLKKGLHGLQGKGIFKGLIKGGEGPVITDGCRVFVEYAGFVKSKQSTNPITKSQEDVHLTFVVPGPASLVHSGINEAIRSMTAGEVADFYFEDAEDDFGMLWDPKVKPDPVYARIHVFHVQVNNPEKPWIYELNHEEIQELPDMRIIHAARDEIAAAANMLSLNRGLLAVSRYKTAIDWLKLVSTNCEMSPIYMLRTELLATACITAGKVIWSQQKPSKLDATAARRACGFVTEGLKFVSGQDNAKARELQKEGHLLLEKINKALEEDAKDIRHWHHKRGAQEGNGKR